jgi:hypothetical protein
MILSENIARTQRADHQCVYWRRRSAANLAARSRRKVGLQTLKPHIWLPTSAQPAVASMLAK